MKSAAFATRPISALRFISRSLQSRQWRDTPRATPPQAGRAVPAPLLPSGDLDLFTKSADEVIAYDYKFYATDQGFTLLELLIALGLAMVVLGIMAAFFVNTSRSSTAQNAAASAQQSARAALEFMVYELRMAGLDPLKTAGAGIEEISATGNKLRFSSDRCNLPIGGPGCTTPVPDGDVDDISERVTYVYDPASLVLSRCLYEPVASFGKEYSDGACQSVLDKVVPNPDGVPLFTFLDNSDISITKDSDRGLIRAVILTLTIEEPAGQKKKVTRTYSSRVRLRNIGL